MYLVRARLARALAILIVSALIGSSQVFAQSVHRELPLKHDPQPTTPEITPADLMTRLYIFADDSMHRGTSARHSIHRARRASTRARPRGR